MFDVDVKIQQKGQLPYRRLKSFLPGNTLSQYSGFRRLPLNMTIDGIRFQRRFHTQQL